MSKDVLSRRFNSCWRKVIKSRKDAIDELESLLTKHKKLTKDVQICKVSGSSAGIVGSTLTIIGFALAFETFGASLILSIVGGVIGGAGALTGGVATAVDFFETRSTFIKAQKLVDKANSDLHELVIVYEESHLDFVSISKQILNGGSIAGGLKNMVVNPILDGVKLGEYLKATVRTVGILDDVTDVSRAATQGVRMVEDIGTSAKSLWTTSTNLAKGFSIAGVVFSVITVPLDIYTIVTSAKQLNEGCPDSPAQKLQDIIDRLKEGMPAEVM